VRYGATVLGIVLAMANGVSYRASAAAPSANDLLALYDQGHADQVAALLARLPNAAFAPLRDNLKQVAVPWTRAAGANDGRRRRLVAATVALEILNARLQPEWHALQPLLEFGCDLVRQNPPGDGERAWQLASIAVAEASGDRLPSQIHINHSSAQFPADARFRFAQAVVIEEPYAFDRWRRDAAWQTDAQLKAKTSATNGGQGAALGMTVELDRREHIRAAAKNFLDFVEVPDVRGEAKLRIGHAALLLREPTAALPLFKESSRQSDLPDVVYLSYFFAGQAFEMLHRPTDAEAAYRQALQEVPNVQSGVEALAKCLYLDGRRAEAYDLVQSSFDARPTPIDIWRQYAFGEYMRWPALITELRRRLS
jgi:tetratricopeptide (TPR) repeat protein